jgi:hypothetical protein
VLLVYFGVHVADGYVVTPEDLKCVCGTTFGFLETEFQVGGAEAHGGDDG